jgi:hypothetical protein
LTAREDLQEARYWSRKEKVVVERTITQCTQGSREEDSVWTGDELLAVAESIAYGIRQGLVKINSWSDAEWDGLLNTVLFAIRQIFNDDSSFVPVEDRIFELYSNDYDEHFAQAQGTTVGERAKPKTKEEDTRKWKALAPMIQMKSPFRKERHITLRATAMGLKSRSLTVDRQRDLADVLVPTGGPARRAQAMLKKILPKDKPVQGTSWMYRISELLN